MATKEFNDLSEKTSPDGTEHAALQEAAGGAGSTKRITFANLKTYFSSLSLKIASNLSDLDDVPTARTNLGLGDMSTQDANEVAITGGSITGITDIAVADGGTGASTAADARTNLGLVIGTDVQAYDADTAKYDDATANFTGTLQNGGSNVVVDTDIGSTVQAYDADTTKNDVANTFTADQTFNEEINAVKDIVLTEQADHSSTPGAGYGYLWVKDDDPSSLIFTDDAGTDYDLTASSGWSDMTEAVWTGGTQSEVADGASAIAFEFDTDNDLSTSGAKLLSLKNNGSEKAYFDKDGGLYLFRNHSAGQRAQLQFTNDGNDPVISTTDQHLTINNNISSIRLDGMGSGRLQISSVLSHINYNTTIAGGNAFGYIKFPFNADAFITMEGRNYDDAKKSLSIYGKDAYASATTNIDGGDTIVRGGHGSSGSAGDADGGAVSITGGAGYGTGDGGDLNLNGGVANGSGASGSINIAPTQGQVGFFAATAVAQQSGTGETTGFTAGSGTGVNDDSTFTGNVGSTAYRINDIVKALKNYGLLAS